MSACRASARIRDRPVHVARDLLGLFDHGLQARVVEVVGRRRAALSVDPNHDVGVAGLTRSAGQHVVAGESQMRLFVASDAGRRIVGGRTSKVSFR